MWARNLLFLAVVVAAVGTLRASLFPLYRPARAVRFDPGPTVQDDFRRVVGEVDASFRDDWAARGLTPAPRADDLNVARRLSLALTGTVPSLEEIRQFELQPPDRRVDGWATHLLRDPRFGDYVAERLSRAYVGVEEGPIITYRKRKFLAWLSDRLMDNTSYGHVVREMIAGRGLNTDNPAVNFIAATYVDEKKAVDPEKLAIRTSRAFLGLRLDCAQCHDHFLEPTWKQTDFQGLAAFYGQTRQVVTHVSDGTGEYQFEDRKDGGRVTIAEAVPFFPDLLPPDGTRRERLAAWVTDKRNVYFARATVNRVWAMMFNKPLLKRVESQTLDEAGPPALDILARDFAAHDYDLHRLILLIASAEVFRLDSAADRELTGDHERAWAVFPVTRLRPEQVIGSVLQAASVQTINRNSHVVTRLARYFNEREFVQRYGETGDDEFEPDGDTIPQRLLMLNGRLVNEKAKEELLNASSQIAALAPDDAAAVEAAYLAVLTRRPTAPEAEHFTAKLEYTGGQYRRSRLADLYWVLFNSTEMSSNR